MHSLPVHIFQNYSKGNCKWKWAKTLYGDVLNCMINWKITYEIKTLDFSYYPLYHHLQ